MAVAPCGRPKLLTKRLSRGLTSALDSAEVASGQQHRDIADGMLTQLDADLSGPAARDPERVRDLVDQCIQSDKGPDHELALGIGPSLVNYDYAFARDTLVSLYIDGLGGSDEGAMMAIPRLMRDHLTPDQVADFNAHLEARGWEPMTPDRSAD